MKSARMRNQERMNLLLRRQEDQIKGDIFDLDTIETDIYSMVGVEQLLDDDETSPREAAFMEGYDEI